MRKVHKSFVMYHFFPCILDLHWGRRCPGTSLWILCLCAFQPPLYTFAGKAHLTSACTTQRRQSTERTDCHRTWLVINSHYIGLVNSGDTGPLIVPGILKRILSDALTSLLGDELDTLHNSIDNLKEYWPGEKFQTILYHKWMWSVGSETYHMLDPTVFSLSVLPNGNQVHISVGCFVALNGHARSHVRVQVKRFPQQQVHRWMAGSYWRF